MVISKSADFSLLAKMSTGDPSGSNHGQPLNCQAGPCTNTATTRSLPEETSKGQRCEATETGVLQNYEHLKDKPKTAFPSSSQYWRCSNAIRCPPHSFVISVTLCVCFCSALLIHLTIFTVNALRVELSVLYTDVTSQTGYASHVCQTVMTQPRRCHCQQPSHMKSDINSCFMLSPVTGTTVLQK